MMQSKSTHSQKPKLSTTEHGHQIDGWHCTHPEISPESYTIQYHTTLLSLCREICFLAHNLHKSIQYS